MTDAPLHTDQDTLPGLLSYIRETVAILWKDWPTEMFITALDTDTNFSLSGKCPHCRRDSVFIRVSAPYTETKPSGTTLLIAAVMQCQGCRSLILGIASHPPRQTSYWYEQHYPLGAPDETVHASVPKDVADDFREAIRCQWVKAFRACVVMCRRAIQTSALALNAKGQSLVQQIDDLAARGTITAPLKEFAHEIRLTGNAGAHADGLAEVAEPDADAIMEFTREYLDHVYVMPAKLRARKPQPEQPTPGANKPVKQP